MWTGELTGATGTVRGDPAPRLACLRLIRFLEPGFLFVLVDPTGRVELSGASSDSLVEAPESGSVFRPELFDPVASSRRVIRLGSRRTYWWAFEQQVAPGVARDARSSREVLYAGLRRRFAAREDLVALLAMREGR